MKRWVPFFFFPALFLICVFLGAIMNWARQGTSVTVTSWLWCVCVCVCECGVIEFETLTLCRPSRDSDVLPFYKIWFVAFTLSFVLCVPRRFTSACRAWSFAQPVIVNLVLPSFAGGGEQSFRCVSWIVFLTAQLFFKTKKLFNNCNENVHRDLVYLRSQPDPCST